MNYFVLDFNDIKSLQGLHQYLKAVFSLPDYYGNNMDALWDCLFCCYDASTTIELRNLEVLHKRLAQTTKTMLEVFQDLHDEDGVIIKVIVDDSEKCLNTGVDELLGYMI